MNPLILTAIAGALGVIVFMNKKAEIKFRVFLTDRAAGVLDKQVLVVADSKGQAFEKADKMFGKVYKIVKIEGPI